MKEPLNELHFNALTSAWLPLLNANGTTTWASPVEVLAGEKDAPDLDWPRDDFRVYARLLLSALVQALFRAKTKQELIARIETPMKRAEIEARIAAVARDFDLFGKAPFLQITPPSKLPDKGAAAFVFGEPDLYQLPVPIDAISLPVALVTLFIEQAYAGGAGRGYGAGPTGQPGALTLIDPGSVRRGAWANSLSEQASPKYAADDARPWSNATRAPQPRASIGLAAGLFFQPRSIWLIPAGTGRCSFTGVVGPLVRLSPFSPKSSLTKKPTKGEDLWQHPCAPLAVNSTGIGSIRLSAEQPAWTGLAQLLDPVSKGKAKVEHPREGPAPVLVQWRALGLKTKRPDLLVLDFDRDKANVKRRFFEAFPLTRDLLEGKEAVERLRALVADAQNVERALVGALMRAHDDRKAGGLALADAKSGYWSASEGPFLTWIAALVARDESEADADARIESAETTMRAALRKVALRLFDASAALSELDPRKAERVAAARRRLTKELWPRPADSAGTQTKKTLEVTS
jgi:CRISPR type I-E-associated protein CasA/Cse1